MDRSISPRSRYFPPATSGGEPKPQGRGGGRDHQSTEPITTTTEHEQLIDAIHTLGERLAAAVGPNAWERLPYVLTPKEAADVMGVSEWAIREYCRQGVIRPHRRIGDRLLISRDGLRDWLAEGEHHEEEPAQVHPLRRVMERI